ncbi:MAG: ribonuclease HI [Bacteroidales bacterium]
MAHRITIYTDGAARGNPGPGGYGVVLLSGKHRKELSGGYRKTTNNRMELLAVIKGFEAMKNKGNKITLYTDSKYIADAVNKGWVFNWEKQNFKKKKNVDLWKRFLEQYRKHDVEIIWVEGHSNVKENERCDKLAVEASKKPGLLIDKEYEKNIDNNEV